jgi:large subunit ribosomal protein L9
MKIILLKDVPNVGQRFEIKTVADGFALNFLIPQKSAEIATEKSLKKIEVLKAATEAERAVQSELLAKNLKDLNGKVVTVSAKTNEQGHLFKGLHQKEILAAIAAQTKLTVPADALILEKPIKEVGEHKLEITVGDKKATVTLNIESEKQ